MTRPGNATRLVRHLATAAALLAAWAAMVGLADARTVLKNICRVKGQEEVTLHGLGLVVGLKGTGDGADALPTIRALARAMELMHMPIPPTTGRGKGGLSELKDAKNVALVMVSVTVPATGAQRGDKLDCQVNAISAKSLAGGRLFVTPLLGPDVKSRRVYAMAQGQVELDDPKATAAGKVHKGCRLEVDFAGEFVERGIVTLVLDKDHADFQVAADVAELINTQLLANASASGSSSETNKLARAIDAVRIEVPVPAAYLEDASRHRQADLVGFVSEMLSLQIPEPQVEARVVINQRAQSVVINGDVEIGAVVVARKNITVEAGGLPANRFVPIDLEDRAMTPEERARKAPTTKLKSLLEALNAIKTPTEDIIEIIKGIERNGKLHAKLIVE